MPKRSAARPIALTAAQLGALALAVAALRSNPMDRPLHRPVVGFAMAPLLVYALAVLAAALTLFAAARSRRTPRRPATRLRRPPNARRWRIAGWIVLAVAALAVGVPLLLGVLPHRAPAVPPSAGTGAPSTSAELPLTGASPAPPRPEPSTDLLRPSLVVLPLLLVLLGAGALLVRRGPAVLPSTAAAAAGPEHAGPLVRATELGLRVAAEPSLEPGAAIVACYAAMERALAENPDLAPHAADTPSEVLARAVEHGALEAESAATLVELFAEARFSRHRITEAQRQAAVAALKQVLVELRGLSCSR